MEDVKGSDKGRKHQLYVTIYYQIYVIWPDRVYPAKLGVNLQCVEGWVADTLVQMLMMIMLRCLVIQTHKDDDDDDDDKVEVLGYPC